MSMFLRCGCFIYLQVAFRLFCRLRLFRTFHVQCVRRALASVCIFCVSVATRILAVARVGPTVLVVTDLEGHPRSMIFILSERAYATS